jgi:hypothetical protein
MKRLCHAIALSLLLTPASAMTVTPDFIGLMKSTDDAIVEATVTSVTLRTWRDAAGEHVCAHTLEIAVNEVLWGAASRHETLLETLWFPRQRELRDLVDEPYMAAGGTYVLGIEHAARRPPSTGAPPVADPAEAKCLEGLPKDRLGGATRVHKEPERPYESWSGMPGQGREYVRIPVTRAIEDKVVFGAFYERFYRKTDKPDPGARAFLAQDGIFPPAEASGTAIDGQYFQDDGRNGPEGIFYDAAISLDDFKRLIRDPNRKPILKF